MKKFLAIILTLALVLSMSTVAFAARTDNGLGDEGKDVTITIDENDGTVVHFVVIEWGSMAFTYQEADNGSWNEQTHSYTGTKTAGWVTGVDTVAPSVTSTITIENHSNTAVSFDYKFGNSVTPTEIIDDDGVSAVLSVDKTSLANADDGNYTNDADNDGDTYADGDKATVTLTVSGTPGSTKWSETAKTLDTIVITIF